MILETRAVAPFFKNGFVVGCEDTREGVVIDPGDEVGELLAAVDRHRLTIRYTRTSITSPVSAPRRRR